MNKLDELLTRIKRTDYDPETGTAVNDLRTDLIDAIEALRAEFRTAINIHLDNHGR